MTALRKLHDSEPFALRQLAARIREMCGDDDQAFVDTLDGQTDAVEAARAVVRYIAECEANRDAMKALSASYDARAKVHADRIPAAKDALLAFLNTIETPTLRLPEATLSVKAGVRKVVGEQDPARLPDALVRIETIRKPDMAAIKGMLETGFGVEGYSLSNGAPTLQVRTK